MSRSFRVDVQQTVTQYTTVYVTADNFDEALQRAENGYWDDSDVYDSYAHDDHEVTGDVMCQECDCDSDDCECDQDSTEENPDAADSEGVSVQELSVGDFIQIADDYTENHFPEDPSEIFEVVAIREQYSEQVMIRFARNNADRSVDYWYVNQQCRFLVHEDIDAEEFRAEKQEEAVREQAAQEKRWNEQRALAALLNI